MASRWLTLPPGFPAGASHGSELMDLFDVAGRRPITSGYYTPAQRRLARDLITYWTTSPAPAIRPAPGSRRGQSPGPVMPSGPRCGSRPAPAASGRRMPRPEHQCAFWLR